MNTEINKKIKLEEEHIKAIEKGLDHRGAVEIIVRLENEKVVVIQSYKKRII